MAGIRADAVSGDRWRWPVTLALLVLLYLLLRVAGLERIVTVDEPFWLARSANFYRALWQGDLAATFQHAHPGVTTMWAGMVGYWFAAPGYVDAFDSNLGNVFMIDYRLREMGLFETDVLVAARLAKIGLQAALFALSLVYLRRLFGVVVAIVAGAVIALDPFLIAHDRLLHIDGLFAITSFVAVLALADAAMRDPQRVVPWIVAGCLAAVAWLTRVTGLALIGVAGIVLLIDALARRRGSIMDRTRAAAIHGALWLVAALATTVALWPALWVAPAQVLSFMTEWITEAAAEGHERPLYFMGEIHSGDPGVLFYPVTIVWRLSVAGSIGLVLAAVALAVPGIRRALPKRTLPASGILLLFALIYITGMTLGAKKFDRYVLPIYPVLDVIAAIGIVATVRWVLPGRAQVARLAMPVTLGALLLAQTVSTLDVHPHYLAAYNPLLGGADAAEEVVQMGWGEGVDAAARWVIEDSGARPGEAVDDPPVLRITGSRAPLRYALPPPFVVAPGGADTAEEWAETDYYVATIQLWQRDLYGITIGYLRNFEPAYTVWIEGVRYVDVWDLEEIPPPPWLTGTPAHEWRFEPWLQLENIVIDSEEMTLWFRTLTADGLPEAVVVTVELVSSADGGPAVEETWAVIFEPRRGRGLVAAATLTIPPLDEGDTGDYVLTVMVHDGETGEPLPASPPESSTEQTEAAVSPRCGPGGVDVRADPRPTPVMMSTLPTTTTSRTRPPMIQKPPPSIIPSIIPPMPSAIAPIIPVMTSSGTRTKTSRVTPRAMRIMRVVSFMMLLRFVFVTPLYRTGPEPSPWTRPHACWSLSCAVPTCSASRAFPSWSCSTARPSVWTGTLLRPSGGAADDGNASTARASSCWNDHTGSRTCAASLWRPGFDAQRADASTSSAGGSWTTIRAWGNRHSDNEQRRRPERQPPPFTGWGGEKTNYLAFGSSVNVKYGTKT